MAMYKTLICGFETVDCNGAINKLQSDRVIDIKVWIGDSDICTVNVFDLFAVRIPVSSTQIPDELYDRLYKKKYLFNTIYDRHYYLEGGTSISSHLNIFNILIKYLYDLVVKNEIELILFSNIPHEGPDFLLYEIAMHMNIKTVICNQSLFPNMFFLVGTMEDYGKFESSKTINNIAIKETIDSLMIFEKPLFYMKGASPLSLKKRIAMMKPYKSFIDPRRCLAIYRFYNYTNCLNELVSDNIDLTAKYIYFPLHLQPELTTVPLGNEYFDQALALEELHSILPPGWKIYVKENPKQTEYMRDPFFFARIGALKNLVWVPRDYDTHTLTRSCTILATITGTAGWEALMQKKPVVVFGNAWYKEFPNVYTFSMKLELLSIATASTDMTELYNQLNLLQKKMGNGVVDPGYSVLVKNYSTERNCGQVFESLHRYIGTIA